MNTFDNKLDRRGKPTRASNYEVHYFKVPCSFTDLIGHKIPQKHTVKLVYDAKTLTTKKIEAQCEHRKDFAFLADLNPEADSCVAIANAMRYMAMRRPADIFEGSPETVLHRNKLVHSANANNGLNANHIANLIYNENRKVAHEHQEHAVTTTSHHTPDELKVDLLNKSILAFTRKSLPLVSAEDSLRKFQLTDGQLQLKPNDFLHVNHQIETAWSSEKFTLVRDAYNTSPIAKYEKGVWILNESNLFSTMGDYTHPMYYRVRGTKPSPVGDYCFFCAKSFPQLARHLEGGLHKQSVKNWFSLLLKAHSTAGLRMLNNPKYKHIFFPKLDK